MLKKRFSGLAMVALLAILCIWSPWLTNRHAEQQAVDSFNKAWEFVADGCGTDCKGCGAVSSRRAPFGVLVTLEYGCGMIPADLPEYHQQTTVFVSAIGTVHGIPGP